MQNTVHVRTRNQQAAATQTTAPVTCLHRLPQRLFRTSSWDTLTKISVPEVTTVVQGHCPMDYCQRWIKPGGPGKQRSNSAA